MGQNTTLVDLKIAQRELFINHQELEKCANELKIANENLDIGEMEKEKLLLEANNDLEDMMFVISHKVRKSVAKILGISNLLSDDDTLCTEEWKELLKIIIVAAESLNKSTEELSKFIHAKRG
jgi:signal transduction histidine kinase